MIFDTVGRLGWAVDVRHHVISEVVTKVLGADVWWGDEEADEGVELSRGDNYQESDRPEATAGFNPGKDGDKERKGKGKRNVPKAIIEEGCIVCQLFTYVIRHFLDILVPQDCYKWEFGDFLEDKITMA